MCWLQAIDFTEPGRKAIKSSNLLRTKWFTMDTRINGCWTHMFLFQVYEEAFPLEWNLDYVHPATRSAKRVNGFAKLQEKWVRFVVATPTRERSWSKSYSGILQHHWRPNPPSKGHCWYPKNNKSLRNDRNLGSVIPHQRLSNEATVTMALCNSTPYNSSVRAVLRKQSSASLCFSPLERK